MNRRHLSTCFFVLLALSLAGCVYLRLNLFRHQLADFPANFDIAHDPAPVFIARKPILLSKDVHHLTGLQPTSLITSSNLSHHVYHLEKYQPRMIEPTDQFDMPIELFFRDDKLFKVRLPERFARFITRDTAIPFFSRIDNAAFSALQRDVSWNVPGTPSTMLQRHEVEKQFGHPFQSRVTEDGEVQTFLYKLRPTESEMTHEPFQVDFDLTLRPEDHRLIRSDVRLGRNTITIHLVPEIEP